MELIKIIKSFLSRLVIIAFFCFFFITIYLDSLVNTEFKKQAWNIPAMLYARPLEFSLGLPLKLEHLEQELKLLGYRKRIKAVSSGEYESYADQGGQVFVIRTRPFEFWDGGAPAQTIQLAIKNKKIVQLINFNEQLNLNYVRLDPLFIGNIRLSSKNNQEDRQLIELTALPKKFIQTLLIIEDSSFYEHWGLSISGIARAIKNNFTEGKITSGGSTLTQQLIKNHFLSNSRSFIRKGKEAVMSVLTEIHYDKQTILEAYINEIYLGQDKQIAIHGFARASEFYFDKPINKLKPFQIALLVGLVKGASYYNPRRHPDRALSRRNLVLKKMAEHGLMSEKEYQENKNRSLTVVARPRIRTSRVPAFKGLIRKELLDNYSSHKIDSDGYRIFTSLDPIKQQIAERSLQSRINKLDKSGKLQGSLMIANTKTGEIEAVVGDKNPNYVGFNRAINAYRQTGSIIKPFVYLTAIKNPSQFNLVSKISDKTFSLTGTDGSLWSPQNYDKKEHGDQNSMVLLKDSLLNSYNVATAHLALLIGIGNIIETIEEFGFERVIPAYPSISLGSKEMSVLEILNLYQVLANKGVAIKPNAIIAVQDQKGHLLKRYSKTSETVIDEESAFLIRYLLSKVTQSGTAKKLSSIFSNKVIAGKTGTTNDLKDSWYAGFDNEQLAIVWLGRDDNKTINLTGSSGALLVWADVFKKMGLINLDLSVPDNIVFGYKNDGFFASFKDCKSKEIVPFYRNYFPRDYKICEI